MEFFAGKAVIPSPESYPLFSLSQFCSGVFLAYFFPLGVKFSIVKFFALGENILR
jgi:hypothetical protein